MTLNFKVAIQKGGVKISDLREKISVPDSVIEKARINKKEHKKNKRRGK